MRTPRAVMMFLVPAGVIIFSSLRWDYFQGDMLSFSVIIRMATLETIIRVLSEDWVNVLFGVGNLLRTEDVNFQSLYGQNFWHADLGWVGIVFEYGVLGCMLIAYIYILLFKNSYWYDPSETPVILMAIRDYFYMTIVISPLVSFVPYFTGTYATILAIFVYYNRNRHLFDSVKNKMKEL